MDEFIIRLIPDYCAGTLDKEKAAVLRKWIDAKEENRQFFEKCLQAYKMNRMVFGMENIHTGKAWHIIERRIYRKNRLRIKMLWSVAAVLAVLMTVALSLLFRLPSDNANTELIKVVRIEPGTTKATLELANGTQIDLTQNDLKEITEQNGGLIINDTLKGLQYELSEFDKVKAPVFHTITVPVGGEYHFTLSDGSKVWINSGSELVFPALFVGEKREVFVKGEVYFEVAHREDNPFVVHAGEADIRVLGTKFNVAAYPEESCIRTTLAQGKVSVDFAGRQVELIPGFQAVADKAGKKLDKGEVDVSMYISWIKGVFEYENMTLASITTQLSRWYDVEFEFSAPEYKDRRFTGVVKKYDDLNDVLKVIEKTTDVRFVINGKNIAVKSGEAIR